MGRAEYIFERIKSKGLLAIDDFILTRQAEELYLDFKRSADNGKGPRVLHQNDRNNLAKAISGFGNSEGGVIVWGVEASAGVDGTDVAKAKFEIENVKRFISWLEGAVSGCTIPPHPQVSHQAIDIGAEKGFVVTLVTKSYLAPHQSIVDSRYYIRSGSSFSPTPYGVLASMFGRRPQPWVFHNYVISPARSVEVGSGVKGIQVEMSFLLINKGPGIARDLFSSLKF